MRLLEEVRGRSFSTVEKIQLASKFQLSLFVLSLMLIFHFNVKKDEEREAKKAEQAIEIEALKAQITRSKQELAALKAQSAENQRKLAELKARTSQLERP
jgi:septal ring factor EnvC (AmiA/AmiB activator)